MSYVPILNLYALSQSSKHLKSQVHQIATRDFFKEFFEVKKILKNKHHNIMNQNRDRNISNAIKRHPKGVVRSAFESMSKAPWNLGGESLYTLTFLWGMNREINAKDMQNLSIVIASGSLGALTHLYLGNNKFGVEGMKDFAAASRSLGRLAVLGLSGNHIGDTGMSALKIAISSGSLASLTTLGLANNQIGNEGMTAFAAASGSLGRLKVLDLQDNKIGNDGMTAFSRAIASGSLGALEFLALGNNQIGVEGMKDFAAASRSLGRLKVLGLDRNQIGDAGLSALASTISSGSLPSLKRLWVDDGPLGTEHPQLKAACEARGIKLLSAFGG